MITFVIAKTLKLKMILFISKSTKTITMFKFTLIFCTVFSFSFFTSSAQSSAEAQPPSLETTKSAAKIKITGNAIGFSNGLKIENAIVNIDTTIRVSPKTAYLSIDFVGIKGSNLAEIASGKNSFWIMDKNGRLISSGERFLKQVKGSLENSNVDYTVKIHFKLKTDLQNVYTVRFLFESKDKLKLIDIKATR